MYKGLERRLRQSSLAHVAEQIVRLARPAICLECWRVEEAALPVGASKLGGLPDLPPAIPWPEWQGEAMAFIAQIRLSEIASFDEEGDLPHTGLLSFFFATNGEPKGTPDDDNPETWRVLYFDDASSSLVRQSALASLGPSSRFFPCAVRYSRRPSLPDVDSLQFNTLGLTSEERLLYIRTVLDTSVVRKAGDLVLGEHHLLGYPDQLNGGAFWRGYMWEQGISEEEVRDWEALAHQVEAEWRVLLELRSTGEAGMDWVGGGVLLFGLPQEALQTRDFSRVWVDLDFV